MERGEGSSWASVVSRRQALKLGLAAAAALTGGLAVAGFTSRVRQFGELGYKEFAGVVGKSFQVQFKGRPSLTLRLADARPLPRPAGPYRPAGEGFSLRFEGPPAPVLAQDTYRVENATLGSFDIFLVPIGPQQSAPTYEAVVNRFWR
jgi:hypothetical protein